MRRLLRSKGDRVLLEGPHLVGEALALGLELDPVLATPGFLESGAGRELAARLPSPPLAVEARLLDELADADSPRGLVAAARVGWPGVEGLAERVEAAGAGRPVVWVEGLQDPGNLGALARSAEAAGAAGLALAPGTVHPGHPRALRGSAGSLLRLPVALGVEAEALDAALGAGRAVWMALVPRGGEGLWEAEVPGSGRGGEGRVVVLALGAEGPGLSAEAEARAQVRVTIPLAGTVESLNATVAASLVLFELARRRGVDIQGEPRGVDAAR